MSKGRPQKYNRITSQQKFMLRRLIIKEKMSVKQAASVLHINYSTAKTIMFFYRKSSAPSLRSFSSSLQISSLSKTASYVEAMPSKKIEILYSTDGSSWVKSQPATHDSTEQHNEVKAENSFQQ